MLKTMLRLPDGSQLLSGPEQENAIQNVKLTACVNKDEELMLGSVCANMLEADLQTPYGGLELQAGTEVTAYKVDTQGNAHLLGLFTLEEPKRPSANTMRITAYDRITWLDKDLSQWLAGLNGWPYSLFTFANMVCNACGLTLTNESLPNGDYRIQHFSAQGITGRKLMQWVGETAGRFCRATPEGHIEFAWYEPSGVTITPDGDRFYYQNSLSYEDYGVMPVEKVQIKMTRDDVGVIWPDEAGEKNTYIISGNYLLTTTSTAQLQPVAQTLYEQLKDVTYTPCQVKLPAGMDIHAGHTVQITDKNGKVFTAYVMSKTQTGQTDTLKCTGSYRRDTTTVVNNQTFQALSGRMLELQQAVEGFSVIASQIKGNAIYSAVEEFYQSDSSSELMGGSWSQAQPQWEEGKFIWRRFRVTRGDDTVSYTPSETGVCITGNTGADGKDGADGIAGQPGADGVSTYFYVKYSANPDGNPMTNIPEETTRYMGVCTTTATTAPTAYTAYQWSQCRGNDGAQGDKGDTGDKGEPGATGADGRTQYLHIKYSDDGETFTANNGEELGAWIGTLVDFTETDSTTFSDYTWKKFTEDVDEELGNLNQSIETIRETVSTMVVDDDAIRSSVSNLEKIVSSNSREVLETKEEIASVNLYASQLEVKIEKITDDGVTKISNTTGTFNEDGLEIDSTDSATKTQVTPDGMTVYAKSYGGQAEVLTAKSDGVDATNLHAKTYLMIGGRSRFENYGTDRTGCFWIGG